MNRLSYHKFVVHTSITLGLLGVMGLASFQAQAQNVAVRALPSSGTFASKIYWLDWTGLNATLAAGAGTQSYSFNLVDGSTLSMDLTRGGPSTATLAAQTVPTFAGAAMGNAGYTGFGAANVALYATSNILGNLTLTLSNIVLTNPAGSPVTNFEVVMADSESMDNGDGAGSNITFTTTGGNWSSLERVPAAGREGVTLTGLGTTSVTQPQGATPTVPAWILSTSRAGAPFTISANMVSQFQQGVMLGIRLASVTLNTNIAGRVNPADQLTYSIRNATPASVGSGVPPCSGIGDCTTSGAGTGPQTAISTAAANGNALTLRAVMAAGSVSTLAAYTKTISCTNGNAGSPTVLPASGPYNDAAPPVITPLSASDDISCTISFAVPTAPAAGITSVPVDSPWMLAGIAVMLGLFAAKRGGKLRK
jgi:hypothetical protein